MIRQVSAPFSVLLALAGCSAPAATPAPTSPPRPMRSSAPTTHEIDCKAIQTTEPDSPAFGLLLLSLEGAPHTDVSAAAHDVMVAHAAVFDDPAAEPLIQLPLTTLRVRCQIAYPNI